MKMSCIKKKKVCILLLIGLPGSGKTEMCKLLMSRLPVEEKGDTSLEVEHICYDQLLVHNISEGKWRSARNEILLSTQCRIEQILQVSQNQGGNFVFLIDDNMYYQSMRRMYYRLATKQNYAFCQLFLKCNLENAMKRVKSRNMQPGMVQVTPATIQKMASRLEPPNLSSNWESNSLIVDTSSSSSQTASEISTFCYTINEMSGLEKTIAAIQNLIESSISSIKCTPVQEFNNSQSEEDQNDNSLQNLDVAFRKCISLHINAAKSSGKQSKELNILAQKLNVLRRSYLAKNAHALTQEETESCIEDFVKNLPS